jgi:hypothetical protein
VRSAPVAAIDAGQYRLRSAAANLAALPGGPTVEDKLLATIQGLIRQGDDRHAQHVAEL